MSLLFLSAFLVSQAANAQAQQPAGSSEPSQAVPPNQTSPTRKRKLIESVDDKGALMGLNAVVRYGGLWPAGASVGAHWYMREYVHLFRYIGFGMDAYFLSPAYSASLYGYPVQGFEFTGAGRVCFTGGAFDLCGSIGMSDAMMKLNVGPETHISGAFASFHPSINLAVLPNLVINMNSDIGWYFTPVRLLIDGRSDQPFEPGTYFMMFSLGIAYRVRTQDF